jgi:hypothetical protein
MPLIEKAFAKVNINYEMITSGGQAEAARFLTGAPSQDLETNTCTTEELWDSLALNLRQQHIITAASFNEFQGLQPGQGVIVKSFTKYTDPDGTVVRLLKVKNPWKRCADGCKDGQKTEYTGRYNNKDRAWTDALKQQAGFEKLRAGEFFMLVEDFKQAFKRYTITRLRRDWKNSFVEKRNALNKKTYRFNFTITDEDMGESADRAVQREVRQVARANAQQLFGEAAQFEEKMHNDARLALPKQEKDFDIESIQEATEGPAPPNFEDVQLGAEMGSDGDDEGDEDGGNGEEDEDDEQQTSVAEQMETTSSSSSADSGADDESDLTQLDRAPSRKKSRAVKREAVIDLE